MKQPQLSGIATALAKQGRHGDDTLIHVSRKELAALQRMGDGLGVHLTKNPQTGLPEAFNWLGTLGGIAGGVIGTIIAPGAGTAAGAAIGSAAGTAAGGGSTKQALMAGLIGGVTGYFGGAGAGDLAAAGENAAFQEASNEAVQATANQALADTAGGAITNSTYSSIAPEAFSQMTTDMTTAGISPAVQQQALSNVNATMAGNNAVSGMSNMDKIAAGWNASPDMLAGQGTNMLKTGAGLVGIGALNPTETSIATEDTSTSNPYKGEMYQDPATGQWRSRAVKMAMGGDVYGQYDSVEEAADGGYIPGGGLNFSGGGDASADAKDGKTGIAAFYEPSPDDVVVDGVNWTQAAKLGPTRRKEFAAAKGGIGDLGGYSDGGRMLKGPGDGVSDSIPASIENKRPARLADGEFVIPARAVSELGNGSTEAGSKQLYKMLDRIAAKRKSGKGLAYQANPEKLLPA